MGACLRCGKCCEADNLLKGLTWFEKFILASHKGIKIFRKLKGFKCPHLRIRRHKAICKIYDKRPEFCKKYPADRTELIEGCGFYFKEKVKI